MKTVAGVVSGYSDNLLLRAADVCLKERRKLVLVAREAPLSTLHLRNLYEASQLGAVILPPVLTYYHHPVSVEDCTRTTVQRILSQFGLDQDSTPWEGME
jgi:polyprenyl P-hydroxybenzoate/phenylacrylic acid decarboxylase-like protein